jgi:hypothetical protein
MMAENLTLKVQFIITELQIITHKLILVGYRKFSRFAEILASKFHSNEIF